ncbi:MAG TPA: Uma2 family endonuclease [Bacillota bacterium]|nr:Uma2 family endonuclease [Bacillota bacterium]
MILEPKSNERYTYADYLSWNNDERWELIDGIPYNMTPAPSPDHQRILLQLSRKFADYLEGKPCEAFIAPFDVRLFPNENKNDDNVVQPDLTIICDPTKITKHGCEGVPDLIIEVLSPSTAKKDKREKKRLYERAGVKEYWIVDPLNHTIDIFTLTEHRKYEESELYGKEEEIKVGIFEELLIQLNSIFVE